MVSTHSIKRLAKNMKIRISNEAIEELKDFIRLYSLRISKIAIEISKVAKRKTVRKEDVLLAIK
jgi:histone H3/H4